MNKRTPCIERIKDKNSFFERCENDRRRFDFDTRVHLNLPKMGGGGGVERLVRRIKGLYKKNENGANNESPSPSRSKWKPVKVNKLTNFVRLPFR